MRHLFVALFTAISLAIGLGLIGFGCGDDEGNGVDPPSDTLRDMQNGDPTIDDDHHHPDEDAEPLPERILQSQTCLGEGGFFGISGRILERDGDPLRYLAIGGHYADISGGTGEPAPAGRLYLFSTQEFPHSFSDATQVLQAPDGSLGGGFAYTIGNLCDANGDGVSDLPVGNHLYLDPLAPNSGRVVMFWGAAEQDFDPTRTSYHRLSEGLRARSDVLGQTVLCVDVNADGFADLIATGQNAGPDNTGLAAIYFGGPEGLPEFEDLVLTPPLSQARQYLGSATLWADLDGDGLEDLAIGGWGLIDPNDPGNNHTGGVLVFLGGEDWSAGHNLALFPPGDDPQYFGTALHIAELGGQPHLFVGAPKFGVTFIDDPAPGAVYVYRVGEADFDLAATQRLEPPAGMIGVGFGQSFAYINDYYGADRGALLVGMRHADANPDNTGTGAVAVFRYLAGAAEPFDGVAEILLAPDPRGMDSFGGNIVPLGDVNADGLQDFLIGIDSHIEGDIFTGVQTGGVIFYY